MIPGDSVILVLHYVEGAARWTNAMPTVAGRVGKGREGRAAAVPYCGYRS